ncbi:required for meiotic nuclear division protein 1 homolog isoform X2 [Bicyclus anynana]|uniref:Required for meiotic nuclear division protein 1 homolog isoform X2 n=1 Tax=Bicyclus anynana TaxID=110368 RepID=A0A6J1ND58_BICAN|nr:required for meiotic nuclear division protein 1 homolog isoform X2 [Bicyclus anynana]
MTVYLSRFVIRTLRPALQSRLVTTCFSDIKPAANAFFPKKTDVFRIGQQFFRNYSLDNIQPTTMALDNTSLPLKKKTSYKKVVLEDLTKKDGQYLTLAYATAYRYDLKALREGLLQQKLYEPGTLNTHEVGNVVVASPVYSVGDEPREIIFFQEGAVVFWNCTELEANNVLDFIRPYEVQSYPRDVVTREREIMTYQYQINAKRCSLQESSFVLVPNSDNSLERYSFSHAMAQSARLGAWEARLEALAASVRAHTERMEAAGAVHVEKKEVVRKLGELLSLRHRINVESDLLDTPDCYWEDERLEMLYSSTVAYFTIPRRTRVLNERLSHCVELLELLSSWAADRHHVRLEWMVIALIMAEVLFELLHCFERYVWAERQPELRH